MGLSKWLDPDWDPAAEKLARQAAEEERKIIADLRRGGPDEKGRILRWLAP